MTSHVKKQDTLTKRDIGDPWVGAFKGISNGDFIRSLFGNLLTGTGKEEATPASGNNSSTSSGSNGGVAPQIPWPRAFSDALNQLEAELSRVIVNLQQVLRVVSGRGFVDRNRIVPIVPGEY